MIDSQQQIEKVKSLILINHLPFSFISLIVGFFSGILVVLDPSLTNIIANALDISITGKNILKLYPYELSSLFFFIVILVPITKKFLTVFFTQTEKSFVIVAIIASQTPALHNMGRLDGFDLVTGIFLIIFLFERMINKGVSVSLTLLDVLNILLISVMFLSVTTGGITSILGIILVFKTAAIVFLITNFIYKKDILYFFIKWFIVITTISAVIGIFQEIIYIGTGTVIVGNVDKNALKLSFQPTSFGPALRVPAFTKFYKNLTFVLIPCIIIVFNFLLYKITQLNFKTKALLILSLFLTGGAIVLTFSMDSILGVLICILISIVVRWRFLVIHLFAISILLFLVVIITGLIDDLFKDIVSDMQVGEARIRLQLARDGIYGLLHKHPWLGVGIERSFHYTANFHNWPPHNAFIAAACDIGLLGLIPYSLLIGYILFISCSLNLIVTESKDKAIARGLLFGIVGTLISMQFHPVYMPIYLWMYMGVVQVYTFIICKEKEV